MSSMRTCTARASATRTRRRLANQDSEDMPLPRKVHNVVKQQETALAARPSTATDVNTKKRKRSASLQVEDPVDSIGPNDIGDSGRNPPLRYYGWPLKYDQVLEYAKRHHLRFHVVEQARTSFEGKEEMAFADLPERYYSDPKLLRTAQELAASVVCTRLANLADLRLDIGAPLSEDFDGILYVWDNHTINLRCDMAEYTSSWENRLRILGEAIQDMTGGPSKLQWWHSWKNRRLRT